ncbi:MAG: 30S ribosomal protein S13 [Candidatus Wildermuthbacteria bacterium RIFCSPHIGHO2_12_FULL_45_9]|uniref:Small ribosomal subunit protein uS13 n=1 Tax=Candidatus Wildermuthbacteria bacterium RIFCSPHIGHO2_02_FULL_45_25 TaxID=1802450 RepID=A0A1G2QXG2_9BACT|nr:MAG: 30S ribosomal protein S13 [Candidatus Wildermuthbacteria bacterium RIFCSPHIGHO2_01_FULL_45_20]OHA65280.1 MAG: 30S ribosomal protein S13 [Candidatus Wildermuthbacteria bacterium RIFCSPHIGHO2_02_FULL_45_25]OHA70616.1 MAG: 30S ribosomal protein S13 [Candidatus Wildermuthbacteria bacterium RIFCSPHIGHO2_12_FULL_45_9]
MPRLSGINIPDNKPIRVSLTYIYGIGETRSKQILKVAGIDAEKKAADLSADELNKIREFIEKNYRIEGDLRRDVIMSIRRLRDIGCWRGNRHAKRLPVRGQRTKTNNRTIRGNVRKTVTSGRKPAATPT